MDPSVNEIEELLEGYDGLPFWKYFRPNEKPYNWRRFDVGDVVMVKLCPYAWDTAYVLGYLSAPGYEVIVWNETMACPLFVQFNQVKPMWEM